MAVDPHRTKHKDGYSLRVTPTQIELFGGSPAGCFHGLQTLHQLSDYETSEVRCIDIVDWPDFSNRGLLHDISRGKVPTLATLKQLVDRLALLKINHLQLYIEHAFVFDFDADICNDREGLTPDEVRELDRYCQDRFIVLVPAVANLGHMGRILSMPKYRHLSAVQALLPWEKQDWPTRARGLTLACTKPEAKRLVEQIWSEIFDAFTSPCVNICGDEPWDLGADGRGGRLDPDATGDLYLNHIRWIHDLCQRHGRSTLLWSDVIRNHPQSLNALPTDMTLLHWGYDDQADYTGTTALVKTGLPTWVCPGTSGWKRILNALGLAERNISTFAKIGYDQGAAGLLNTDWGDHGHFNALACSWHGIALGAACAWRAAHHTGAEFDRAWAKHILPLDDAIGVSLLRQASRIADQHETWRLLWTPANQLDQRELANREKLQQARIASQKAADWWVGIGSHAQDNAVDISELATACTFHQLLADRLLRLHSLRDTSTRPCAEEFSVDDWNRRLRIAVDRYAENWMQRNKPAGLPDILQALDRLATEGTKPVGHGFSSGQANVQ